MARGRFLRAESRETRWSVLSWLALDLYGVSLAHDLASRSEESWNGTRLRPTVPCGFTRPRIFIPRPALSDFCRALSNPGDRLRRVRIRSHLNRLQVPKQRTGSGRLYKSHSAVFRNHREVVAPEQDGCAEVRMELVFALLVPHPSEIGTGGFSGAATIRSRTGPRTSCPERCR